MGGQACVFYGAAEFSRDCDVIVLSEPANFEHLSAALTDLHAHCIAVPPFDSKYLDRGHAVHFRCTHDDVRGIRLDVMVKLRGVDSFGQLWDRRTTITDELGFSYELLAIEDLVQAKKTQRDKDWPMIRRLVEAHYVAFRAEARREYVEFWLRQSRSPEILLEIAAEYPEVTVQIQSVRPLLQAALDADLQRLEAALQSEQQAERDADIVYWKPLKEELERLRRERRSR